MSGPNLPGEGRPRTRPQYFTRLPAGIEATVNKAAAALKTGEATPGIARLAGAFAPDHPYRRVLGDCRAEHGPSAYPGSPQIAAQILRPTDRIRLAELHPQEVAALRLAMSASGAVVEQRDGTEMALSVTPPDPARGLCLIDPSYEVKTDFATLPRLVTRLHKRWSVGVILLWYPILEGAPHAPMVGALTSAIPGAFTHEVTFPPARLGHRMTGSGLFVVNPPFGLAEAAAEVSAIFLQATTNSPEAS